jgi:RIO-like serine/threonine protein kinase
MRDARNWLREKGIATPFERTVGVDNLLYGKSERKPDAHSVKLDRKPSVRDVNNVMRFFKRKAKRTKRNDYRRENDKPC